MRNLMGAALAIGLAAVAGAAEAGAGPAPSDKLDLPLEGKNTPAAMAAVPSNDQLQREYPQIALSLGIAGDAVMTCFTETDGRLDECQVDSESPAGLGFGAAALRLAAYFTVRPATLDGRPIRAKLTVPIRFQLGNEPAVAKREDIGPPTSPEALPLARQVIALQGDGDQLHRAAHGYLEQLNVQLVANGDVTAGERVADAYRQGLDDAIADEIERRARLMAATMTADQLRTTLGYLQSPAGAALRAAQAKIEDPGREGLWLRVVRAIKVRLCERQSCPGQVAAGGGQ